MYNSMSYYIDQKSTKQNDRVALLWCLWVIVSSGAISIWRDSGSRTILINLLWIVYFILKTGHLRIRKDHAIAFFTILFTLLAHMLILYADSHIWAGTFHIITAFVMTYYALATLPIKCVIKQYCKIISWICIASLVTYVFQPFILRYRNMLPRLVSVNGEHVSNYTNIYVSVIKWEGSVRNCGMFWEPGAFQVFLNLALLFELFVIKRKSGGLGRLALLIITIATTVSTAGLFNMCILIFAYILATGISGRNRNVLVLLIVIAVGWALFSNEIVSSIEYKFGTETGEAASNVTSRTQPFLIDLEIMMTNPLGIGADRYAEELNAIRISKNMEFESSSCTPTIMGAAFGIHCLAFVLFCFAKLSKKVNKSPLASGLLFVFLVILFATESFILYPLFYLVTLAGIFTNDFEWSR